MHLWDGWTNTPAEVGDIVHVLAHVQEAADGTLHAECNSQSGAQTGCFPNIASNK